MTIRNESDNPFVMEWITPNPIEEKYSEYSIKRKNIGGKRHYVIDGIVQDKPYISVTTLLNKWKDMTFLVEWRNRIGHEKAAEITRNAARRGTQLHNAIESYIHHGEVKPDVKLFDDAKSMFNCIRTGYIDKYLTKILFVEQMLWSTRLRIAGTVDFVGYDENGDLCIVDWKNSEKPKRREYVDDYFKQCAIYGLMIYEMTGLQVKHIVIPVAVLGETEPTIFKEPAAPHMKAFLEQYKREELSNGE